MTTDTGHCTECDGNGYHTVDCPDNPDPLPRAVKIGTELARQIFATQPIVTVGKNTLIQMNQKQLAAMLSLAAEKALG